MRHRLEQHAGPLAPARRPAASATAVLLRDGVGGLEMLLVRRNARLDFHGGAWVFPGGRVDVADAGGDPQDALAAPRRAAAREVQEEAGVSVDPAALVPFARWTTPEGLPKRFETWFFAVRAGAATRVRVDGGEILEHRWITPTQAIAARATGELELPGPTFVSTTWLLGFASPDEALAAFRARPPRILVPRVHPVEGGLCSVYQEDVAYADGDLARPGPRHRLWMLEEGWRYEQAR